jgi:hypothetical protein
VRRRPRRARPSFRHVRSSERVDGCDDHAARCFPCPPAARRPFARGWVGAVRCRFARGWVGAVRCHFASRGDRAAGCPCGRFARGWWVPRGALSHADGWVLRAALSHADAWVPCDVVSQAGGTARIGAPAGVSHADRWCHATSRRVAGSGASFAKAATVCFSACAQPRLQVVPKNKSRVKRPSKTIRNDALRVTSVASPAGQAARPMRRVRPRAPSPARLAPRICPARICPARLAPRA